MDGLLSRRQQISLMLAMIRELIAERDTLKLEMELLQSEQASQAWRCAEGKP